MRLKSCHPERGGGEAAIPSVARDLSRAKDLGAPIRAAARKARILIRNRASRARHPLHVLALLVACVLFVGAGDDARYNKLGHAMICGCGCRQILLECNHVGCQVSDKMVRELRVALTSGDSDDLVMQAFVQRYGETVRAAPEARGFNLVAWIAPFAMLMAGLLLAILVLRRWSMRAAATAPSPQAPSPQLDAFRHKARQETEL